MMKDMFPTMICKMYNKHGEISGIFDYDMGGVDGTWLHLTGKCHSHVVRSGQFYRFVIYMGGDLVHTYYITPVESYMDALHYNLTPIGANAPCPQYACEFNGMPFRELTNVEKLVSGLL